MASTTPASTQSPVPYVPSTLELQQLIGGLIQAMNQFTPDGITASGEALQKQLTITEGMKAQLAEAQATIAQAQTLSTSLDARMSQVNISERALQVAQSNLANQQAETDRRIQAVNNTSEGLAKRSQQLDTREAGLDTRSGNLDQRENDVANRTRMVTEREEAVTSQEAILANTLKQLGIQAG